MNPNAQGDVPLISVVIPTNRIDPWLALAIDSVLSQRGVEFELIVYLDGINLPENTSWAEDQRVRIIQGDTSRGVGHALRAACSQAVGTYIARLDSDDIALPGRLQQQAAYLDDHEDTVAVSGQVAWVNDAGDRIGGFGHQAGADVRGKLLEQNVVVQSAVMFRRDAYSRAGGYSPMRQMEDYDLWLRLGILGKIANIDLLIVEYRIHDNQVSREVHPHGKYVNVILRERRKLAHCLGRGALGQLFRDVAFRTALYMMYCLPPALIRRIRSATAR